MLKWTLEQFIENAIKIHDGKYTYENAIYVNSNTKLIINCSLHGIFLRTPRGHIHNSAGCPKCNKDKQVISTRFTTADFIERATKIHDGKYTYENAIYIDAKTKLKINCSLPLHGEFLQEPNSHINARCGCPKCGKDKLINSLRSNTADFIKKANKIHNGIYTYDNTNYINNCTKVIINCSLHGPFSQIPQVHIHSTNPSGCPKCRESKKFTTEEFIAICNINHNNKYIYDKTIYTGWDKNIIIKCPEHGYFSQRADHHKDGFGCKKCWQQNYSLLRKSDLNTFISKAKLIHGDKYNYDNYVYDDCNTKGEIKCNIHGSFFQSANQHIYHKLGCKKCNMCPSCGLWRTMGKLCEYCKPKNQNKLYQKTKEMEIVRFLKDKLPDNEFIHNKSVGSDCSGGHLFPDILFDCGWYSLIVEIDEFQHRGYECDKKRMVDIIAKLGMPCIFIRYNPDNKNSDKRILLNKVTEYLNLTEKIWDDYGFLATYLFYK